MRIWMKQKSITTCQAEKQDGDCRSAECKWKYQCKHNCVWRGWNQFYHWWHSESRNEPEAIINIIRNSPAKKRKTEGYLYHYVQLYLAPFTNSEILDILVVVSQALCRSIREVTKEMRLEIRDLPKRTQVKRKIISEISKSSKHYHKVQLLETMNEYYDGVVGYTILKQIQSSVMCGCLS